MCLAEDAGRPHTFVLVIGWHADVGEDDVGCVLCDRREELAVRRAQGHDLDVGLEGEEGVETLADKEAVLGYDHPDHDGRR